MMLSGLAVFRLQVPAAHFDGRCVYSITPLFLIMSSDDSSVRPLGASLATGAFVMIPFDSFTPSGLATYREILGCSDTSRTYQASRANRGSGPLP